MLLNFAAQSAEDRAAGIEPFLRLEPRGAASYITSLSFSPDGQTLYAGGWDKVVRVWRRQPDSERFAFDANVAYRIPLGPHERGLINTIALSPDGRWLAVAGRAPARGESTFRDRGRVVATESATEDQLLDIGTIFLFDTNKGSSRQLRGHRGVVLTMTFAPGAGDQALLISTGYEGASGTVRSWQINDNEALPLASQTVSEKATNRPGLAVVRRGQRASDATVAIAWGDGQVRLWDLERNELRPFTSASRYDDTVVGLSEEGRFVAGGLSQANAGGRGVLRRWSITTGRQLQRASHLELDSAAVPRALAVIPTATGRGSTWLSTIVALENTYELQIIEWRAQGSYQVRRRLPLWKIDDLRLLPALAVSADGKYLAAAGSSDQAVRVFTVRELLQTEKAPTSQLLTSAAVHIAQAAFVGRGDDIGLALQTGDGSRGPLRELRNADLIFDLRQRKMLAADQADGWSWVPANSNADTPATQQLLTDLAAGGYKVTAHSVATLREHPVLAVAMFYRGNSLLWLYDAQSGTKLRECNAHTLPVRNLVFSDDANLLISTGDDQMLCVWSLAELDRVFAASGAPPVKIEDRNGQVTITLGQTTDRSLQPEDVLRGVVEVDEFLALKNAAEYYRAFGEIAPGSELTLRRSRGGRELDIAVAAIPNIDEAQPLFSLFLTKQARVGGAGEWDWIGWSPLGPYDSSGDNVEQFLGWHFNTGRDDAPTLFARAEQYRDQYRQPGLLEKLVRDRRLITYYDATPIGRPAMALTVPDAIDDSAGSLTTRLPPRAAYLNFFETPADEIDKIQWSIDEQHSGEFQRGPDGSWAADLSHLELADGEHTLSAVVTTLERQPQTFRQHVRVNLASAAPVVPVPTDPKAAAELPQVHILSPAAGDVLELPRVPIVSQVDVPESAGDIVVEALVNDDRNHPLPLQRQADGNWLIEAPLQMGDNAIEVRAHTAAGTTSDLVHVIYRSVPRIVRTPAQISTNEPLVDLQLEVESDSALERLEINHRSIPIDSELIDREKSIWRVTARDVPLTGGENDLQVHAWNASGRSSAPGEFQAKFVAETLPPQVRIVSPAKDQAVGDFEIDVEFEVSSASPLHEVVLLRNQEEVFRINQPQTAVVDSRQRQVLRQTVHTRLQPGANTVHLLAVNEGGLSDMTTNVAAPSVPVRIVMDEVVPGLPDGRATLKGHVDWFVPDERLDDPQQTLRVWVNGFQQVPVWLTAREPNAAVRRFQVPLVLTRAEGNVIEMSLPSLAEAVDSQTTLRLDWSMPDKRQALHLLVLGVGVSPEEKDPLVDRALEALHATRIPDNQRFFTSPSFTLGRIWGPLVGDNIRRGQVLTLLAQMQNEIRDKSVANNVVLIYYQGGEIVYEANRFYLTTRRPSGNNAPVPLGDTISSDTLRGFILDTHGAHVLLLDVARRQAEAEPAALPEDSRAALLRFAWSEDDDAPQNVRLVAALRNAVDSATQGEQPSVLLRQIESTLSQDFEMRDGRRLSKAFPERLSYESFVPTSLSELVLTSSGGQ